MVLALCTTSDVGLIYMKKRSNLRGTQCRNIGWLVVLGLTAL